MEQRRSSYTEEEIMQFRADEAIRENKWGMSYGSGTVWIPFDKIKEDHLVNIIDHIKIHKGYYDEKTLEQMKEQLANRLMQKTTAGLVLYGTK